MEENFEQPQVPQTTNPQNGELDKLYSVVSQAGLYTKSKDEFKTKYSTPENIDKLYSVASQAGLYTKSKDDFYSKYYPNFSSKAPTQQATPVYQGIANSLPTMGVGNSSGDIASLPQAKPKPLGYTDVQRKMQIREEDKAAAVKNYITKKGIKENTPQYQKELQNIDKQIFDDNLTVSTNKNGEKQLFRTENFGQTLWNTLKTSVTSSADALKENNASDAELLEIYKQKDAEPDSETRPSGVSGYFAELGGGIIKPIALQSLNAIMPTLGTGAMVAEAYNTARANQTYQLYREGLREGLQPEQALAKAKNTAQYSALGDAASMYALSGALGSVGNKAVQAATKTFKQSIKDVAKGALKVGGIIGAAEGSKVPIESASGYDRTVTEGIERTLEGVGSGIMMDLAFKTVTHAITNPLAVPKAMFAAAKNLISEIPREIVDAHIEAMPEEVGKQVKESIDYYQKAKDKINGFVPENQLAWFAGRLEKADRHEQEIKELELSKVGKPEFVQNQIDTQIKEVQKKIDEINDEVNKAAKKGEVTPEKDDVTGLKLGEEPSVTVIKPEENKPIETIGIGGIENKPETNKSGVSVILPSQNKKPDIVENKPTEVTFNGEKWSVKEDLGDTVIITKTNGSEIQVNKSELENINKEAKILNTTEVEKPTTETVSEVIGNPKEKEGELKAEVKDELPDNIKNTLAQLEGEEAPIKIDDIKEGFVLSRGSKEGSSEGFHSIRKSGGEGYAGKGGKLVNSAIKKGAKILKLVSGDSENYSENAKDIEEFYKIVGEEERAKKSEWAEGEALSDITTRLWNNKQAQAKLKKAGIDIVIGDTIDGVDAFVVNKDALEPISKPKVETPKEQVKPIESKPTKEGKQPTAEGLMRADAKKVHAKVSSMEAPVNDARQIALRYIADGFKKKSSGGFGKDAIEEIAGHVKRARLNTGEKEKLSQEVKDRDYYNPNEKRTLDQIVHDLWERSNQEVSERDIKDALMEAVREHNTRLDAGKAYLERYNEDYAEEQHFARIAEERAEEFDKELKDIEDWLKDEGEKTHPIEAEEEHINNLIKQYEAEFKAEDKQPTPASEGEIIETPSSRTSGEEVKDKEQKSSKPKKTESVTSIEPPFTLIKTELERARTRVGLGDYEKETITDERAAKEAENAIKEWKEKGIYNKEIDKIIEDANSGKISDLGNNVLAQHIADLEVTGKSLDRFSKEYDKNRAELKRAIDAGDSLRSAAGRILGRDLKIFGEEVQSVQDIEMQMMQDGDTDILTKEQKIEAEKRFNEYKGVADKEAKLRVEAEAEIEKLKAELEIAKAKKAATPTTKKTKGDYQAERKDIVKSIKDKWNKAGNDGTLTAVPIPYAKQLAAIAPDVAKLLNSYITEFKERGIDITLEKARELLKKDINEAGIEVSDEDVRGLIAGRFNEKKQTKSELVTKRQDLVAEENLLLEIEELEKGGVPKTEIGKRKRNQKFKELRDRIKELKKIGLSENIELPSELDEQQKKFETAIKTQIANNKKEQARIDEKIKRKDYSEDEKKSKIIDNPLLKKNNPKLYEEYLQAIEDKYNAKLKLEKDRIDDKIKNRSGLDKIKDWANIAFTTTQSTVAGFDQSMVMVQLLGHTLSHPINTAKFARDSFKDMFSKRFFDRRMATLHNTVLWDTIEKSGLVIYEPRSFKAELRAEQHGGDKNLWNKSFVIGGKKYSIGQAFERSTTGFINNARISLFLNGVEKLQQQGKTFENSPKEYEALARVCNEWTGHGKVQRHIQMGSELVNKVIWSPKMLASTFNILGLGDLARPIETTKEIGRSLGVNIKESGNTKGFYSSLTPKQRAFMRNEMLRALGTASLLIGTGMLTGAIDDFDFDPRSSGFGSVTKGDITVNLFGRFASAMRTIVQVLGGEKKTDKGVYTIGEKYGSKKTEDVLIGGFGRGKMTPAAGMAYDYFLNNKKNYYTEKKVTPTYMAKNLAVPMSLQGAVKDIFQSDEKLVGLAKTISKSYGFDVKDKADYKESLKIKKENKILERKEKIRKLRETLKKANKKP